jgi:hypothetical protein
VRTVLPRSSVDAPAFEPRGNAESTAALALCDAGLRARLGRHLAGVAAIIPRARRCLSRFLLFWAVLPCATAPVRCRGRATSVRAPTHRRSRARLRTLVHPRTRSRPLGGQGRAFGSIALRRAPR